MEASLRAGQARCCHSRQWPRILGGWKRHGVVPHLCCVSTVGQWGKGVCQAVHGWFSGSHARATGHFSMTSARCIGLCACQEPGGKRPGNDTNDDPSKSGCVWYMRWFPQWKCGSGGKVGLDLGP